MNEKSKRRNTRKSKSSNARSNSAEAKQEKPASQVAKQTETRKHVKLNLQRPKLTHKEASNNRSYKRKTRKRTFASAKKDKNATLKVIPLGGLDAIGKNMTVFECNGDMVLDDAGLMFPDDNHPGVDLVLPDYTYILQNAEKLRGIVITHGHEDHTGCLPYLMKDLGRDVPIYGTKMTLGLIEGKFKEHNIKNAKLCEIKSGTKVDLGCINCEFFSVNHSIPGAVGVFFKTPAGNVLHTGDFKLDQTPIDGVHTAFESIARFGHVGVDLMMSDSTNAGYRGFTPSEAEVGKALFPIISQAKGRVIIASFASHIHRLQQICDAATSCGRKVVVTGRSMVQNVDIARRLGYLHVADEDIIDAYDLKGTPPNKVVVMCTGSQGEPLSALARIANGDHKTIAMDAGDTVIISATPVPGNEKAVTKIVNNLAKIGADVYDKSRAAVHVSGHASNEELKIMLSLAKPKAFMPVHGEAKHLREHAQLAADVGVNPSDIFICENGQGLELSCNGVCEGEVVQSGVVFVDGLSVGDMSADELRVRGDLGNQGVVCVSAALSCGTRTILGDARVEMRGVSGGDDAYIARECENEVEVLLQNLLNKGVVQISSLKKSVRQKTLSVLWQRTKTRPVAIVSLIAID